MPTAQLLRARPDGRWPVMASLRRHYQQLEKQIASADGGTIRARWEHGRLMLVDDTTTTPGGRLRHGAMAKVQEDARKAGRALHEREIQRRLQCGRTYPTEGQIRHVVSDFETWHDLVAAGFPPYEADAGERPFDPRTDHELAVSGENAGAEILPDPFEQMALFGRFTDESTLAEMQRYCSAQAEMTARFAERDDKRQRYLTSLIKAVDGDLTATWAEARAALAGLDGGDSGA